MKVELDIITKKFNENNFAEVIDLCDKTLNNVQLKEEKLAILNYKGIALLKLKKFFLSELTFKECLKIEKKNIEALYNLSFLYFNDKKYNQSLDQLKILLKQNPYFLKAYFIIFNLKKFINEDSLDQILMQVIFLDLTKIKLNDLLIFLNYLVKNEELEISKLLCEKLLKTDNHYIFFLYGLILRKKNQNDLSLKYFLKAFELNANNPYYSNEIGSTYEILGDINSAKIYYEKSVTIDRYFGSGYRSLADIKMLSKNLFEYISCEVSRSKDESFLMHSSFALGKYHFDNNNYEQSYFFYTAANNIKDLKTNYDENRFKSISKFYNYNCNLNIGAVDTNADKLQKPIFLVGMPRSGSTLIEQVLSSHSKIDGFGEKETLQNLLEKHVYNSHLDNSLIENNMESKNIANEIKKNYYKDFKQDKSKIFFIDKMLFNFFYIGVIIKLFPLSKIIICKRDLRDIFLSIIRNYFGSSGISFAYNPIKLESFFEIYVSHLSFWLKKAPKNLLIIEYEKLVNNPKYEVTILLNELDLDFEDSCINFYKKKTSVNTASSFQVRSEINSHSVKLWSKYEKFYKNSFDKLEKLNSLI